MSSFEQYFLSPTSLTCGPFSFSAWLPHSMTEITDQISQRIRAVTGLSLETAEDLQVGNYGLGGHYAPHFDFGRVSS